MTGTQKSRKQHLFIDLLPIIIGFLVWAGFLFLFLVTNSHMGLISQIVIGSISAMLIAALVIVAQLTLDIVFRTPREK